MMSALTFELSRLGRHVAAGGRTIAGTARSMDTLPARRRGRPAAAAREPRAGGPWVGSGDAPTPRPETDDRHGDHVHGTRAGQKQTVCMCPELNTLPRGEAGA